MPKHTPGNTLDEGERLPLVAPETVHKYSKTRSCMASLGAGLGESLITFLACTCLGHPVLSLVLSPIVCAGGCGVCYKCMRAKEINVSEVARPAPVRPMNASGATSSTIYTHPQTNKPVNNNRSIDLRALIASTLPSAAKSPRSP